jgi:hypothetical protein
MEWSPGWYFNNDSVHPVIVDALLLRQFGPTVYDWEPETLWREMQLTWSAFPNAENRDCVQTVRTIHTNTRFTYDWFTFEKVVMGLNGLPVLFTQGQKPTLGQVLVAIDAINIIRKVTFDDEIARYVAAVVREDAAYPVPKSLEFCKEHVPVSEANENAKDDEDYRKERLNLMHRQLKQVLAWVGA